MDPRWRACADELSKIAGLGDILSHLPTSHTEHATDVAGLGAMMLGSGSNLYSQLKGKGDEGGPISPAAASALDVGGLATMAAPTVAAMTSLRHGHAPMGLAGGGSKFTNIANLLGLGALSASALDKMQAAVRARKAGVDPEEKMLLGHGAHRALELGGYGALGAGALGALKSGYSAPWEVASQLAGYGLLAAPHVSKGMEERFSGAARPASELLGMGLLAAPSVNALVRH